MIKNFSFILGKPISIVVPETLVELLPCFDDRNLEENYGNQYLRKCENRAISILKTKKLLRQREL